MSYFNYYLASQVFYGFRMPIMGTRIDVLLIGADAELLKKIWQEIDAEVLGLDKLLSRFDPESEVFGINESIASSGIINVSVRLWEVLKECRTCFELTNGYFDITLHDLGLVSFFKNSKCLAFGDKDICFDFGGYAKGYALGWIKSILDKYPVNHALVNFGNSSVLAYGSHPCGSRWKIGVVNPYSDETIAVIPLRDNSFSVSGNVPRHTGHIINPRTGEYSKERKIVSVIAEDPVTVEIFSTILMVVEVEEADEIGARLNIEKNMFMYYE